MKLLHLICLGMLLHSACRNAPPDSKETMNSNQIAPQPDTPVFADTNAVQPSPIDDTLQPQKTVIRATDAPKTIKKDVVREMPVPGVSGQDKHYIDSVKAAKKRLN